MSCEQSHAAKAWQDAKDGNWRIANSKAFYNQVLEYTKKHELAEMTVSLLAIMGSVQAQYPDVSIKNLKEMQMTDEALLASIATLQHHLQSRIPGNETH